MEATVCPQNTQERDAHRGQQGLLRRQPSRQKQAHLVFLSTNPHPVQPQLTTPTEVKAATELMIVGIMLNLPAWRYKDQGQEVRA